MHASYQIIIQVLQLAYTTQVCISKKNSKKVCNASKHMTMHISNATNQSLWACSPYLCASLIKNFDPLTFFNVLQCCSLSHSSMFFNVAPSLFMSMSNLYFFVSISPKLYFFELYFFVSISPKPFISLYNLSPFVINFHKRCASHWCKDLHWGRWWRLESLHFLWTLPNIGMTSLE